MCNCQAKEYKSNQCDKCKCKSNCALYINYMSCKKSCDKPCERQYERQHERQYERECDKPCKRQYERPCEKLCERVYEKPSKSDKCDKKTRIININM